MSGTLNQIKSLVVVVLWPSGRRTRYSSLPNYAEADAFGRRAVNYLGAVSFDVNRQIGLGREVAMFDQNLIDKLKASSKVLDSTTFEDFAQVKRGLDECVAMMETSNEDERVANSECDLLVHYRRDFDGEHCGVDTVRVSARIGSNGHLFKSMGRVLRNTQNRRWTAFRDEGSGSVEVASADNLSEALAQLMTVCRPMAARYRQEGNRNGLGVHR